MTNRERCSVRVSSVSVGRWAMSIVVLLRVLRRPPYDAVRGWCWLRRTSVRPPEPWPLRRVPRRAKRGVGGEGVLLLLGVELDDQLLLDRGVDDLPGRDAVDEDAQLAADDLQPRGNGTLPGAGLGDL